jgi:hypothetical protein
VGRAVDNQIWADFIDRFFDVGPVGDIQLLTAQGGDLMGLAENALTILPQLPPGPGDYNFHGFSPLKQQKMMEFRLSPGQRAKTQYLAEVLGQKFEVIFQPG